MIAAIGLWLGKSTLMQSPLGGVLKAVPRPVWIALAIGLAALLAMRWHDGKVSELRTTAFQAGRKDAADELRKQAEDLSAKAWAMAAKVRGKFDEDSRAIAGRADVLRLRGPANAICRDGGAAAAGAGGPESALGGTDGGVDRLPYPAWEPLIAVPFSELVDRAERCDLNRAEAQAWRDWHQQLSKQWTKPANSKEKPDGR